MYSADLADDGQVLFSLLDQASKLCAQISSFGEVLDSIRQARNLTQKQFARLIFRSEAEVSRLINNQLPRKMQLTDVHRIVSDLGCNRMEFAMLITAFICHLLYTEDLIDPDNF